MQNPENAPILAPVLGPISTCAPVITPIKQKLKWEKILLKAYIITSAEGKSNSLKLKVEIKTTDTAQKKSVTTLVDSGTTGEFIDQDYMKSCGFNLIKLTKPIPVHNVDGTLNEAGCKGNCKDGLNQNLAGDPKLIYSAIIMSQV